MRKRWIAWALFLCVLAAVPCASAELYYAGYASTPLYLSSGNKISNIETACSALSGWIVLSGETFSFNDAVGPRTREYGYLTAENGRGVMVRGGGVAQVATTLYLALLDWDGIQFGRLRSYGDKFCDGYVSNPDMAVLVDYANGVDFTFTNLGDPFTIQIWQDGESVVCSLNRAGASDYGTLLVGSAQTYVDGTNTLWNNIALAANAVTGTNIGSFETFSFNDIVGPRTSENGYGNAVNGRGVRVCGGGVAQLASTIYLAVRDVQNVVLTEKHTYGDKFNQNYVDSGSDAIVTDYNAGTDFRFDYYGDGSLILYTYINDDNMLCCEVWQADYGAWDWIQ